MITKRHIQKRIDECDKIKGRLQELTREFRDDTPCYHFEMAAGAVDEAIQILSRRVKHWEDSDE